MNTATLLTVSLADLLTGRALRKGDQVTAVDNRRRDPHMVLTITGKWNGKGYPYRLPSGIAGTLYPDSHVVGAVTVERPAPRPARRTVGGLILESFRDRAWRTLDGRWLVSYEEQGVTECENPHPLGRRSREQCPGGQPHPYYGWQVWDTQALRGQGEYTYDIRAISTFTEAAEMLATCLKRDPGGI